MTSEDLPGPVDSTRAARWAQAVALVVPCALLAAQSGVAGAAGFAAAGAVLLVGRRPRPFGRGVLEALLGQLVLGALVTGAYALLTRALGEQTTFGLYTTIAALALAVPRAAFSLSAGARAGTLAFGLLAVMGMARVVDRWPFGVAALAYLVAGLASVLQADPGVGALLKHRRGLLAPFALAAALTGGIMLLLGWGLPAAEPRVSEYLEPYLGDGRTASSGYSDGKVTLGEVSSIQSSDEVMMRLTGASVDRLRGQVYELYQSGRWVPAGASLVTQVDAAGRLELAQPDAATPPGSAEPSADVSVEVVGELGLTIFTTATTSALSGLPPGTEGDQFGRVRLGPEGERHPYGLHLGPDSTLRAPPGEASAGAHPVASGWLLPIARDWGLLDPGLKPADVLRRITQRLSSFRYTLELDVVNARFADPVRDFIGRTQAGHCELFASAMVLLSRQSGVPARFVTGFRAVEDNPAGGYTVVRGRDAHAWVEAFIDGRWQTFDPTPSGGLEEVRGPGAGWLGQRWDLLARALGRGFVRLQNLTFDEILGIGAAVVFLGAAFIALRRRSARLQAVAAGASSPFEPLVRLERHVADRLGQARPPGRTLGAQAAHLRAVGFGGAAGLLEACADLRYGEVGDPAALARAVDRYLREGEGTPGTPQR